MAKEVKIVKSSQLGIKGVSGASHVQIDIRRLQQVEKIAPIAAHIKEVNNIAPLTIDHLRINEIRNLEPIAISKFNVTHLPTVNLALRQMPTLDMNVRKLPPVSVGFYQDFCVPSDYTVRAQLFGVEFLRVNLNGTTHLKPGQQHRQEQSRNLNRSFPETAAGGNPAIPSKISEKSVKTYLSANHYRHRPLPRPHHTHTRRRQTTHHGPHGTTIVRLGHHHQRRHPESHQAIRKSSPSSISSGG